MLVIFVFSILPILVVGLLTRKMSKAPRLAILAVTFVASFALTQTISGAYLSYLQSDRCKADGNTACLPPPKQKVVDRPMTQDEAVEYAIRSINGRK